MVINIKITELNNKSRKGLYLYIKDTNKKGVYFKYDGKSIIDPYTQYYIDKYIKNRPQGTIKEYKQNYVPEEQRRNLSKKKVNDYIQKVQKKGSLLQNIKTGITSTKIDNIKTVNLQQIQSAVTKMFRPIVENKELLNTITQNHNLQKLKSRFEYRINFKDSKGKVLASTNKFDSTPLETINELRNIVLTDEKVVVGVTPTLSRKLELNNYKKMNLYNSGTIKTTEMTIIFRRG